MVSSKILSSGLALTLFVFCGCHSRPEAPASLAKPDYNVILISIDTLAADHLASYGYGRVTSPFLDRLGREGILFRNSYANGGFTLPSHFSIFTGTYPPTHGIRRAMPGLLEGNVLSPDIATLPELLGKAGYHTAWFGTLNDANLNLHRGLGRGWNEKIDAPLDSCSVGRIGDWIDQQGNGKFFAFIHTYQVHDPYYPPSPFSRLYDLTYHGRFPPGPPDSDPSRACGKMSGGAYEKGGSGSTPQGSPAKAADPDDPREVARVNKYFMAMMRKHQEFFGSVNTGDPREVEHIKALYDGGIRQVDVLLEALVEHLRERKLLDRTILVITGDHGEAFNEHGNFFHMSLHGEILRVPLVMHIPGAQPRLIQSEAQGVDILPTILELVGQRAPPGVEGKSLVPLIGGRAENLHGFGYSETGNSSAYWSGGYKLITQSGGADLLFDMAKDPREENNLAEREKERARELRAKLDAFLADPARRK